MLGLGLLALCLIFLAAKGDWPPERRNLLGGNDFPEYPMATPADTFGGRKHGKKYASQMAHMSSPPISAHLHTEVQAEMPYAVPVEPVHGPPVSAKQPTYVRNEYVVTTEAEFTCPRGYNFDGAICSKYDQIPSRLGCRVGWRYENDQCVGVDAVDPDFICDPGYEPKGSECAKAHKAPKQMLCPEGFEISKTSCVQKVHSTPDVMCPVGFDMVDGQCRHYTKAKPIIECPFEYKLINNLCRREESGPGTPVCPMGFRFSEGHCWAQTEAPPQLQCPNGYTQFGTECRSETVTSPVMQCSEGAILMGHECKYKETIQPSMACPPHFTMDESKHSQPVCKKHKKVPAAMNCPKMYDSDISSGVCRKGKNRTTPPQWKCPDGFKLNHQHCIAYSEAPVEPTCPPGFQYDGHQMCYVKRLEAATPVCLDGTTMSHSGRECVSVHVVTADKVCDRGYVMEHGFCVLKKRISANVQCDDGFSPSVTGECARVEVVEPELTCPVQMVLRPDSHTGDGKASSDCWCIGEQSIAAEYRCPDGTMRAMDQNGSFICKQIIEIAAQLECPPGFFDDRGTCTKFEHTSKRPLCPEMFKYSFGQCIKNLSERAVTLCPVTYHLLSGVCVKEVNTPPQAVCPVGYNFDAIVSKCYKIQEDIDFLDIRPEEEALLPLEPEEEALLDLEVPTPAPTPAPFVQPQPIQAPPQITVVQQPIPIPQPMMMLPPQRPLPPVPPPRPYPVPVPVPVIEERPVAVPIEHTRIIKMPIFQKKKKHGHSCHNC